MTEDKFLNNFEDVKRNVLKLKLVNLDVLYDVIDRVLYFDSKTYPDRTPSYYRKHARFIKKLESEGILAPLPYVQAWEVKHETK